MSILITGGLGVIGSVLSQQLRQMGHDVVVCDTRIAELDGYERGDVCQFAEMHRIFKKYEVKHVYHLAGEVGRRNGELFPRRCIDVNVSGTMNLIQLCIEHGATLYFASTSEIYGDLFDRQKVTEELADQQVSQLTNCYAISKFQAEAYIRHFVLHYGLRGTSFRFFMCYGAGERPDPYRSAMANFVYRVLCSSPINVHRNAYRSWCYVDDIVRGCIAALGKPQAGKYDAYNLGREGLDTMESVAELICRLCGRPETLIHRSDADWLVTLKKEASFAKANRDLGFVAQIPLEEGIRRTIEWQKSVFPECRQ